MLRGERNRITGPEPPYELALCDIRYRGPFVVNNGSPKAPDVGPEVMPRMFSDGFFDDLFPGFIRVQLSLCYYVLSSQVVVPEIVKGDDAKLTESVEIGASRRVAGLDFALRSLVDSRGAEGACKDLVVGERHLVLKDFGVQFRPPEIGSIFLLLGFDAASNVCEPDGGIEVEGL